MDSHTLSIIAVIISFISVVIALWSAWTNHQSLKFTKFNREKVRRLQHTKACSELLEEIRVYEIEFERELRELQELEPKFERLLTNSPSDFNQYLHIFKTYKPELIKFTLQARTLWQEAFEWYEKYRYEGYAAHSAQFRRLLSADKSIQNEWAPRIKALRIAINASDLN